MPDNPLARFHESLGAFLVERAGIRVPSNYGEVEAEHRAARETAALFDLTSAGKLAVRGDESRRFLHQLLAQDIESLTPGEGRFSLLLSREGKITSPLRVCRLPASFLLLTPSLTRVRVLKVLERLKAATEVEIEDVSAERVMLSLQGPDADAMLERALGVAPPGPDDLASRREDHDVFGRLLLVRTHQTGRPGLLLLCDNDPADGVFACLHEAVTAAGGRAAGLEAFEGLRIEAGLPGYGTEMDENTLPQEVRLADVGVSFRKGCFLGQEAVSRLEFHGRAPRKMRGVVFPGGVPPVRGDKLFVEIGRAHV